MELIKAAQIVKEKISEFCPEYHFEWDGGKLRFGQCNYRTKTISLSKHLVLVNSEEEVINTILHEVAHAIVGRGHGHNYTWKRKAISIGCSGKRTHNATVAEPNFIGTCPKCQKKFNAYRVSKRKSACVECCNKYNNGRYSEEFVVEYKKVR